MPIWGSDNILFISSGYRQGSRGLRLTRTEGVTKVEQLWHQRKVQFEFTNAIRIGDYVYGTSGYLGSPVFMSAINVKTGAVAWRKRKIVDGKASMLRVGDELLMLDEDGHLLVAAPSPEGIEVKAKHRITDALAWTVPTLVGSVLYVRDSKQIMAFDLG